LRLDTRSRCETLFSNLVLQTGPGCAPPNQFREPIMEDPAAACAYPTTIPKCTPGRNVTLNPDEVRSLDPGSYGDLRVHGSPTAGTLLLKGGEYSFCSVRAGRNASIVARAASKIYVTGNVALGPRARVFASGSQTATNAVQLFVAGSRSRISRGSD